MKVLALCEAGRIGRPSAKLPAQSEIDTEIAIGSRDLALVRQTAADRRLLDESQENLA